MLLNKGYIRHSYPTDARISAGLKAAEETTPSIAREAHEIAARLGLHFDSRPSGAMPARLPPGDLKVSMTNAAALHRQLEGYVRAFFGVELSPDGLIALAEPIEGQDHLVYEVRDVIERSDIGLCVSKPFIVSVLKINANPLQFEPVFSSEPSNRDPIELRHSASTLLRRFGHFTRSPRIPSCTGLARSAYQ
jgi:hypothetical protein